MQYILVSDIVNNLAVVRRDDSRMEFLRHMIVAKSLLKEFKIAYIQDFKRVYIPIDPKTMTVRIPFDFQRFRTISLIEKCPNIFGGTTEKVIPLTHNPYINITPVPDKNACEVCGCVPTHPVCVEIDAYTTLCEEIVLDYNTDPVTTGTRQTVLKTCPNGDIISEVTQLTLKFKKGAEVCDYNIEVSVLRNLCDYDLNYTLVITTSFRFTVTFTLNGEIIESGEMNSYAQIQTYFESYGWTAVTNKHYTLSNSTDVYSTEVVFTDFHSPSGEQEFSLNRHCVETNSIAFPYTVESITINNVVQTESPIVEITTQGEQNSFFDELGFSKIDATHYEILATEDVYYSMLISDGNSPATETTLNFIQSNCIIPSVSDGISNSITRDVLCNVEIKDCGCIVESPSNIETIVSCCAPLLSCCQSGQLDNWNGWGFVPSCCPTNTPQPYNAKGTYNIDEKNFIIYLGSVNATKVLLDYDTDGSCDGDFAIPDYYLLSFQAGIAAYAAEFDETITESRRRELNRNFDKRVTELEKKWTDPIRMADLIGALKTHHTPY